MTDMPVETPLVQAEQILRKTARSPILHVDRFIRFGREHSTGIAVTGCIMIACGIIGRVFADAIASKLRTSIKSEGK